MAQSKNIGKGVILSRVTAGPTAITNVESIRAPGFAWDEVEATALSDSVKYFMPGGQYDPGDVTMVMFWTSGETNDGLLDTDFLAGTVASWKIVWPSPITRTATFSAWIRELTPGEGGSNDVVKRTVVFRLQSAITWS